MATTRNAVSGIMGMVSSTAATVTSTVTTIGDAVDIASTFINGVKVDQKDRQVVHRRDFRSQLLHDAQQAVMERNLEEIKIIQTSEAHAAAWDAAKATFDGVFDEIDNLTK